MKLKLKQVILSAIGITAIAGISMHAFAGTPNTTGGLNNQLAQAESKLLQDNPDMSKKALDVALRAYGHLREQGKDPQQVLTFINYEKPSFQKRFWVIDMKNQKVMYNTYVAQGKNTGAVYAKHFSNDPKSLESSIGVFLTGQTYSGKHGYSMRLHGLDKGFNSNAYKRAVVMHSAWYVSEQFVKAHHRVGRSWGCTALSQKMEPKVVKAIKGGTVMVSYYPNAKWLNSSEYTQPLTA